MGILKGTSTVIGTIPFTELYERLLNLGRIDSPNNTDYSKGIINDSYTRTLPRLEDWSCLITESYVTTIAAYYTGTVAATVGSTSLTGTGTTWTTSMTSANGYKIKIGGNRDIYAFDYASATTATITPALSGPNDITAGTYEIFRDEYDLTADFDRFLRNGSFYVYSDGRVQDVIKEVPRDLFREDFVSGRQDPIRRIIQYGVNSTTSYKKIRVNPWASSIYNYPYEYVKRVPPMSDYQTGTVAVTNASTTVTGTDTYFSSNVSAGDYFRVDGNGIAESSTWYKIASVDSNTQLTLETAYGEGSESALDYTCSTVPSAFPVEFHEFILYDGLVVVGGEQGDTSVTNFTVRRDEILENLKKNYKSRRTNVQYRVGDDGIRSGRYDREDDVSYRR